MTQLLAFFAEFWPNHPETSGSIRDFVREHGEPDEGDIVRYLHAGHVLFAAMGAAADVLGSGEHIVASESLLTDGTSVWRGDLPFYLSRYHLALPAEFVDKVRAAEYRIPELAQAELSAVADAMEERGLM